MKKQLSKIFLIFFSISTLYAQSKVKVLKDGIPLFNCSATEITAKAPTKAEMRAAERKVSEHYRLVYNLKKVYPFSKKAGVLYTQLSNEMKTYTKKDKDEYFKKREKELFAEYEETLKQFTVSQGKLLILLIDRETSTNTYDIIKGLKSWRSAFLWQTVARLFGSNLKSEYDPKNDANHYEIEQIIKNEIEI